MPHDVFISYSTKDKTTADAVCAGLEAMGIHCWIAPRDIAVGQDFSEGILEGIKHTQVMVLIFSAQANTSPFVIREVTLAVSRGMLIIPFRIEDIKPSGSMEFNLSTPHWLDAFTEPLAEHISCLGERVVAVLGKSLIPPFPPDKPTFENTIARVPITTNPPGAAVYIEEENTGLYTPCEYVINLKRKLNLKVLLELKLAGCEDVCFEMELQRGANTPVSVILMMATKINPIDGAEMILIPAGKFLMGSADDDIKACDNEKPQHNVYLDDYYMYKNEVTVAQYYKFCKSTGRGMPPEPYWGWIDNHPVVNVTWDDAKAYANWAGVSLPTEAQWEKAARGIDGRIYPWGNEWDASKCVNMTNSNNGTKPVGSILAGASPYGILDMSGNVEEWCADWSDIEYYKNAPTNNPFGPETGVYRVVRGGSWCVDNNGDYKYRCARRVDDFPYSSVFIEGFRCASSGL